MEGIISLLDHESDQMVREIWQYLDSQFNIKQAQESLAPHISWHVAKCYPHESMKLWVTKQAKETTRFSIQSSGVGIFMVPSPVLYISLSVTMEMMKIHTDIYTYADKISMEPNPYYRPSIWIPHITIAQGDIHLSQMGEILAGMQAFSLNRKILIDNFAYVYSSETGNSELYKVIFGKGK